MKKNIIILTALLCTAGVASAQSTLKTAYFMDRMTTRHEFNPALTTDFGYFALPGVGDLNVGINSNLSVDKLLFPLESGDLGLFAHPDVNKEDFMNGLNNDNIISQELSLPVLSMGFYGFGGYNTFEVGIRENLSLNLQKSLFGFIIGSNDNGIYNMSGTELNLSAWAEAGISHSHRIGRHLTIGAKFKYLAGAANASIAIDKMQFESTDEHIMVDLHAKGQAGVAGMQFSGAFEDLAFDFSTFDYASIQNSGFAVDLGAVYELDKFTFALAVTDIGGIRWAAPSTVEAGASSTFDGFDGLKFDDFEGSTEDELAELTKPFENIGENIELSAADPYNTLLSPKLNIAADYEVGRMLKVGVLSSTTFYKATTISELMGVLTFSPLRWFNIAVSGTTSTYGTYWGWALNFCPHYFLNIYVGGDCMPTYVTPEYIPISSTNLNLKLGINIPLGRLHEAN